MKNLHRSVPSALIAFALGVLLLSVLLPMPVTGQTPTPQPPPPRETTLIVQYTASEWWLVRYAGNEIVCRFTVDHEGQPTNTEVKASCGDVLYNEWQQTGECDPQLLATDPSQCKGMYFYFFESRPDEKKVTVQLPLPMVWLSLEGCQIEPPGNRCAGTPMLKFTGEEPLPNEMIIAIAGYYDGEPFRCQDSRCTIPLHPSGTAGSTIEFWADSSFGDSSQHFFATVRVIPRGDFAVPEGGTNDQAYYYVDVLSDQWQGGAQASCSQIWESFPEPGGPEPWLSTPDHPDQLYTDISMYFLAGMLIRNGEVDASACPNNGMENDKAASECGLSLAGPKVIEWQNRFDESIFKIAADTGLPAQLLKNVFSRESQLWPGVYDTYKEAGLGQLSDLGADTLLLWNPDFYRQFCPLVLHQDYCDMPFHQLGENEQKMLRGYLVTTVNAACVDCESGIDMTRAEYSIRVFAQTLTANCDQVARIIKNTTGRTAGQIASYSDLWRFTLLNYNAGGGCLTTAIKRSYLANQPLTWAAVRSNLEVACQGADGYVEDITIVNSGVTPIPTPWVQFNTLAPPTPALATYLPTIAATLVATPRPGEPTFTPTPTSEGYPVETTLPPPDEGYPVYTPAPEQGYP